MAQQKSGSSCVQKVLGIWVCLLLTLLVYAHQAFLPRQSEQTTARSALRKDEAARDSSFDKLPKEEPAQPQAHERKAERDEGQLQGAITQPKSPEEALGAFENNSPRPPPRPGDYEETSRAPDILPGVDAAHLHGLIGLNADGAPMVTPTPLPPGGLSNEDRRDAHRGFCFNSRVSDSLPLDRQQRDFRSSACQKKAEGYPEDLPPATVVIVFHNEAFSVLVRSIHSVLNTSPPRLLKEIILVDDASHPDDLRFYRKHWYLVDVPLAVCGGEEAVTLLLPLLKIPRADRSQPHVLSVIRSAGNVSFVIKAEDMQSKLVANVEVALEGPKASNSEDSGRDSTNSTQNDGTTTSTTLFATSTTTTANDTAAAANEHAQQSTKINAARNQEIIDATTKTGDTAEVGKAFDTDGREFAEFQTAPALVGVDVEMFQDALGPMSFAVHSSRQLSSRRGGFGGRRGGRISPPRRRFSSPRRRFSPPRRRYSPPRRRFSSPRRRFSPPRRRYSPPRRRSYRPIQPPHQSCTINVAVTGPLQKAGKIQHILVPTTTTARQPDTSSNPMDSTITTTIDHIKGTVPRLPWLVLLDLLVARLRDTCSPAAGTVGGIRWATDIDVAIMDKVKASGTTAVIIKISRATVAAASSGLELKTVQSAMIFRRLQAAMISWRRLSFQRTTHVPFE
eukprot:symbB.v1.2.013459.t1/scaffold955.1/size149113/12